MGRGEERKALRHVAEERGSGRGSNKSKEENVIETEAKGWAPRPKGKEKTWKKTSGAPEGCLLEARGTKGKRWVNYNEYGESMVGGTMTRY